jgi:hypothetical protein
MAGMIKNIFGLNTQDVADQRAELNRLKSAQRIKQGDIDPTVAVLGQQFGDMLGRGLMKKLGYEDKDMAIATKNEQLANDLNAELGLLDMQDPERYRVMAEAYEKAGDTEGAMRYAGVYRTIKNDKRKEIKADWFRTGTKVDVLGNPIQTDKQRLAQLKAWHPNEDFTELEKYVSTLAKEEEVVEPTVDKDPNKVTRENINNAVVGNTFDYTNAEGVLITKTLMPDGGWE